MLAIVFLLPLVAIVVFALPVALSTYLYHNHVTNPYHSQRPLAGKLPGDATLATADAIYQAQYEQARAEAYDDWSAWD